MKYRTLFSPLTVRGLTLKNRVVVSAMGCLMIGRDRKVSQQLADYLGERAKGGVGLIYSPCAAVDTGSCPEGMLAISTDEIGESHKLLTEAVHAGGAKCAAQLWQGSAIAFPARVYEPSETVLPAALYPALNGKDLVVPPMTKEEIRYIVDCYGAAAARAVRAGYDMVEVHCAHGYLPHMFLNPATNRRTDEYGGSLENRARFALEVFRAVRRNMPEDMPLSIRIACFDDGLPVNLSAEDMIEFARMAQREGVDILNISRGNSLSDSLKINVPPVDVPQGFNVDNAARIRRETGMITAVAGRINTPALAEEILDEGKVDLVVMARANLADAEFCNKAASGREDEIVYCIGCCQGCFDPHMNPANLLNDTHITCLRNPALGKEKEYAFVKTDSPKTVLIAGGGMGGMEAAYRLHMLGHKVILCEAAGVLGGQFILAGESPRKGEFKQATVDCARRLTRLGVEVRLNAPVDAALIESVKPDCVIIATGAEPIRLSLPGTELKPVYNSHDVLAHRAVPEGRVCIIGGGMVGLETAEFAAALGCKVTVVEMQGELAADMGYLRKLCTLSAMAEEGIETIVNARCKAINETGVVAERDGEELTIPCDTVVTAVGARSKPCDELKAACERLGIKYYVIGDAVQARRALNATAEGAAVAYEINKA
jgi:2,4-dienoyl-CoA reductase-like NADH-dependent reductase (Old Yellow Enzyme family)/thioredoxin reductase